MKNTLENKNLKSTDNESCRVDCDVMRRSHPYGNHWYCRGCGKDCMGNPKDYYMLKDNIWFRINGQSRGMLCMDCVEKRLGHKLRPEEIQRCALTEEINPYTKLILQGA